MATICLISLALLAIFTRSCSAQGFTVSPLTVLENVGTATFTITPDTHGSPWLFIYETTDGTAVAGTDFTAFPAGTTTTTKFMGDDSVDITVNIVDRPFYQGDRMFDLTFTGGSNVGGITFPATVSITIEDDEIQPVTLSAMDNAPINERDGNLTVTLSRTDGTDHPFNATVTTVSGSATAGVDFVELNMVQFSFAQDEMSKTIAIWIIDDNEPEAPEWFNVTIGGPQVDTELVLEIKLEDNDTPVPFHCLRKGQDCANRTQCDFDTGACEPCEMGYSGADCMNINDNITTDCDPACVEGTCFNGTCKCNPGFTDLACDKKAYFHRCNPTNFSVCITPFGNFMGHIYVVGFDNVTACNLSIVPDPVPEGVPGWCTGYGTVIEFDGECGTLGPFGDGNKTKYEVVLKVQYNPPDIRNTDETAIFICFYENESISVSDPTGISLEPNSNAQGTPNGGTQNFSPATQIATLANGDPLPSMLDPGIQIKVCLTVSGVDDYAAVLIRRIIMDNDREAPNNMSRLAYANGCEENSVLFLTPYFEPAGFKHTMCYNFASFILDGSDPTPGLGFTTEVQVYADAADPAAVLDTCPSRRKRDVTSSGHVVDSGYSKTVIQLTPRQAGIPNGGDNVVEQPQELTETECERKWLMPALIGVGIIAITMSILVAILGGTVVRQFRAKRFQ